jgi:hypothetical protein
MRRITLENESISVNELLMKNEINWNDNVKNIAGQPFCYYTSVKALDKILKSEYIYLNSICNMNDISEYNLHKRNAKNVFIFCLCNSESEKIPMWYLYGGILGNGARIKFTPGVLRDLHNAIKFVYPVNGNVVDENTPLKIGEDFELRCGWVYYQKSDRSIKYRQKWYVADNDDLFVEDNYFIHGSMRRSFDLFL